MQEPSTKEIITSSTNSCESAAHKLPVLAPRTLRMAISFLRCSAEKDARPNRPRQEITIARQVKPADMIPSKRSLLNFLSNFSSVNVYSNGYWGLNFL